MWQYYTKGLLIRRRRQEGRLLYKAERGTGMIAWEPCSDCEQRVDERKLDIPAQKHVYGLNMLEVLEDIKDAPMLGNWMRVTNYRCERCGLRWVMTESASGSLRQFKSTLSPHF